jgi:hypothetical protein
VVLLFGVELCGVEGALGAGFLPKSCVSVFFRLIGGPALFVCGLLPFVLVALELALALFDEDLVAALEDAASVQALVLGPCWP